MSSAKKEVTAALILFVVAVIAGFLIQYGLKLRAEHQKEAAGAAIFRQLEDTMHTFAEEEIAYHRAAAERLKDLPAKKQQRLDDLQLDLLTLVNPWNPVPDDWTVELDTVIGDYQMDARCAATVWQMMEDARMQGAYAIICSAYRTHAYQQGLFDDKVQRVMAEGYTFEDAVPLAAEAVAVPGTSEHELGLAADIIDEHYPYLDQWQEYTNTQKWLMEHCTDYGFILRYPNGTSETTGIMFEPWHYRYVGVKFAREITKLGVTLEEYVAMRRGR